MLIQHQTEIYALVWALTAACILASCIGLFLARPLSRVTLLPSTILVPSVLTIAFVGSWALNQTIGNIVVTFAFGVIGYLMNRLDYPRLPIVIALVLGDMIERSFFQSMMISNGSWDIFVTRPASLILLILLLLSLVCAPLRSAFGKGVAHLRGTAP
jgi:putative tricarboxylic transport membrane protein